MEINEYIDHTLLKPDATKEEVLELCDEAIKHSFKAVCISPVHVKLCKDYLEDTNTLVCTVIGFPLGSNTLNTKIHECKEAIESGADEIDLVINIGKVKEKDYEYVSKEIMEIKSIVELKTLKVIIETSLLSDKEISIVSKLSQKSNADYIKTSTGFGSRGASLNDIKIIQSSIGTKVEIKASGGIKNKQELLKFIEMGVTRIGTSSGAEMMEVIS